MENPLFQVKISYDDIKENANYARVNTSGSTSNCVNIGYFLLGLVSKEHLKFCTMHNRITEEAYVVNYAKEALKECGKTDNVTLERGGLDVILEKLKPGHGTLFMYYRKDGSGHAVIVYRHPDSSYAILDGQSFSKVSTPEGYRVLVSREPNVAHQFYISGPTVEDANCRTHVVPDYVAESAYMDIASKKPSRRSSFQELVAGRKKTKKKVKYPKLDEIKPTFIAVGTAAGRRKRVSRRRSTRRRHR